MVARRGGARLYALLLAAVLLPPVLLTAALTMALDRPVKASLIVAAFACGGALLLPVYGLLDLHELLDVELGTEPYFKGLYRGFVLASAPEELCRFLAVWAFVSCAGGERVRARALVYGVAVMLGFAAVENCVYVYNRGWGVLPARTLTAVPFNAALGLIIGGYLGVVLTRSRARVRGLVGALLATIAIHGAYDAPLLILYETNHSASASETIVLVTLSYIVFGLTLLTALGIVYRERRTWLLGGGGSTTST